MAGIIQPRIVVLIEQELKTADRAIQNIKDFDKEEREETEENTKAWSQLMVDAVKACHAALYHPAMLDPDTSVTVMVAKE